jgi:uncharacterized protein (TIGR02145 family)
MKFKSINRKMSQIKLFIPILLLFLFSCSKEENIATSLVEEETPIQEEVPIENETLTDADANVYNTIKIGEQTWMLENLKTTKFNDGTPITEYTFDIHGINWLNLNSPEALYQWASTNDLNDVHEDDLPFDYYGAMYNHFAIASGKLAPVGWRIPSVQDYLELENYLSINGFAGNEALTLKSSTGWLAFSKNGTDAVGFKGLPNGYINAFGGPTLAEGVCTWATTDNNDSNNTRMMVQLFEENTIMYSENAIQIGAGIRCIKK